MATVNKQDSNSTGLRYAEEESPKTLPNSPVWNQLEPNSYNDFGGSLTKVARNPINDSRQRSKGVTTDLDAAGGFNSDFTQDNLQDILQGLMFADLRSKLDVEISAVADANPDTFSIPDPTGVVLVGSLVFVKGLDDAANNGLHVVTAVTPAVAATGTLDADGDNFGEGDTVTINGVVYTITATVNAAYKVKLEVACSDTLDNLIAAINGGAGEGTDYGTGTVEHPDVSAAAGAGDTMDITAKVAGLVGNDITTAKTTADVDIVWSNGATLTSGVDTIVVVAGSNLVADASPATGNQMSVVGFQYTAGDAEIVVSGTLPCLKSTVADPEDFGLIPGEILYVGGDAATNTFFNAVDNGFKRVKSVDTTAGIEFDKSDSVMVVDDGTSNGAGGTNLSIRVFFASRLLKNEAAALITRRTYQLERTLGAPDSVAPSAVQAEYITGALLNVAQFNIPQADKFNIDLTFLAMDHEQNTADDGLKAGSRPDLEEADAYNTSSDFSRINLSVLTAGNEAPTPLFAFVTSITLNVNNNATVNKAVGVLGGFDITAGMFTVGGNIEAYFADIASIAAIRENSDVTLDMVLSRANVGIFIDVPLVGLGDGRLNVSQDQAIKIPLVTEAARGRKYDTNMDHTIMLGFFDYLPTAAAA